MSKKKKKPEPIVDWVCDDSAVYPFPVEFKSDPVKDAEIMRAAFEFEKKRLEKEKEQVNG